MANPLAILPFVSTFAVKFSYLTLFEAKLSS